MKTILSQMPEVFRTGPAPRAVGGDMLTAEDTNVPTVDEACEEVRQATQALLTAKRELANASETLLAAERTHQSCASALSKAHERLSLAATGVDLQRALMEEWIRGR